MSTIIGAVFVICVALGVVDLIRHFINQWKGK